MPNIEVNATDEEENKEEHISVYEYIEKNYKEDWLKEKTPCENLADLGITSANRWEQFESLYRSNYVDYSAIYMSDAEFQLRLVRKYQEKEEYYQTYNIPAEERIDVFTDEATHEKIWKEMEACAQIQAGDSAALAAFEAIGEGVLQMEHEDRAAISEAALDGSNKQKNEMTQEALEEALKSKAGDDPEYLVRGAALKCQYGSHTRYLDMYETHGVYLNDKPVMHKKDCEVGKNIMPFGICTSPVHNLNETGSLFAGADVDQKGNYLQAPEDIVMTGFLCKPEFEDKSCWENCKSETKIAQTATKGMKKINEGDCYEAITTASYLICKHGGLIYPVSSGQLDYSNYVAPFQNYPFINDENNVKDREFSEEEEQAAFERWCENNLSGTCPYYPGTDEYLEWHQEKIDGLVADDASDKKLKAAYEECLDNAYWYGLDRMNAEARSGIEEMREKYKEAFPNDADDIQGRYSGERLDYGYNTQKNLAGATPEENSFYHYYTRQAEELNVRQEELKEQLAEANSTGDQTIVAAAANRMREFREEKENIYGYFVREVERYDGYLDEEQKRQIQKIKNLFGEGAGQ
ncbi:MAG: DUF4280 domain-containing protein [Lachnospiraceae bacterium]|nr:DUF4280 domain-containing protein [Lachnospiraceae bacterium]